MSSRPISFAPSAAHFARALGDLGASDLVFLMRQCLERGAHDQVELLFQTFGDRYPHEPALRLCAAVARFVAGDRNQALADVERVLAERPNDLNALSVAAEMRTRHGDTPGATEALRQLVMRYPDYPGAQPALSKLLMPGPPYRDVLRMVHRLLSPRTYLEIGVESGATLSLATTAQIAIGVDPADTPIEHALPAGARVVRSSSDAFFAANRRESVFGPRPLDLVFIDGMHLFEFALRDFINAEAWCHAGSTVIFHDCVPLARVAAERERSTRFWVGDTWKVVRALARFRPDLKIRTLLTPPSGLVIVRRLDSGSTLLRERFAEIEAELLPLAYEHEPGVWPDELSVVPNTPEGLAEALG
jgi:hypothetical protein